jgi:RNA polymerase sigma-70 factor (ECF subfamily)
VTPTLRPQSRVRSRDARRQGDAELLQAVASQDRDALGVIYDRYARDVWMAIRRALGEPRDVEDIVQTMFIKLPEIARSYDGRPCCRNWLIAIGIRFALRHRRGMGRFRRVIGAFAATPSAPGRDPELHAELALLDRAVAALSERKRQVFMMVELDGLSAEETARVLEVPAATVRTRLFHARRELREALARAA